MMMCDGVPWNAEDGMGTGSFVELWVVVVVLSMVDGELSMVDGELSMVGKSSMVICVLGLFFYK